MDAGEEGEGEGGLKLWCFPVTGVMKNVCPLRILWLSFVAIFHKQCLIIFADAIRPRLDPGYSLFLLHELLCGGCVSYLEFYRLLLCPFCLGDPLQQLVAVLGAEDLLLIVGEALLLTSAAAQKKHCLHDKPLEIWTRGTVSKFKTNSKRVVCYCRLDLVI